MIAPGTGGADAVRRGAGQTVSVGGPYTSLDIALLAGVSQSTVSRALSGSPAVGAATRQRIAAIAAALDYRVDLRARHLRTRQTGALTLLMFADPRRPEGELNPFLLSMVGAITAAAKRRGYDLILALQQLSDDWHAEYQRSRKSDGLILLGYGDFRRLDMTLRQLLAQQTRFVRWGGILAGGSGVSVGCDNAAGSAAATRHLIALGRRQIAFVGDCSSRSPEFRERYRGYREALSDAGLGADSRLQVDADLNDPAAGALAVRRLLALRPQADAIVAASDQIAIAAMGELHRAGRRVPDDVAVVGFDDIPLAALMTPSLTTVHQDTTDAGERLVAALVAQIAGETVTSVLLPPRLVVRESCGSPGNGA